MKPYALSGEILAKASLRLEQLSASSLVDAKHFFHAIQTDQVCKNIKSLALTSRMVQVTLRPARIHKIHTLLNAAAGAAKYVSKLQIMEIWTGGVMYFRIFRYHAADDSTALTSQSVWDKELELRVIDAQEEVALQSPCSGNDLTVYCCSNSSNDKK